jgi:hypothetical protein
MSIIDATVKPSKALWWTGVVVSALPAAFLLLGSIMNILKPASVVEATEKAGLSPALLVPLGSVLLVSTLLYIFPKTAGLGAILLTGYLGGAVATHVLHSDPWSNIFFPVIFGILIWGGLYLRDPRVRAIVPWRQ